MNTTGWTKFKQKKKEREVHWDNQFSDNQFLCEAKRQESLSRETSLILSIKKTGNVVFVIRKSPIKASIPFSFSLSAQLIERGWHGGQRSPTGVSLSSLLPRGLCRPFICQWTCFHPWWKEEETVQQQWLLVSVFILMLLFFLFKWKGKNKNQCRRRQKQKHRLN